MAEKEIWDEKTCTKCHSDNISCLEEWDMEEESFKEFDCDECGHKFFVDAEVKWFVRKE